jgi:uncharacterized protein YjiS (DUF1127 family)
MSPVNAQFLQGQRDIARPYMDNPTAIEEVAACEGATCTGSPLPVTLRREDAGNDATCDDPAISTHDVETWPQHAYAANGFGDVATAAWPTSYELYHGARAWRATVVGEITAAAIRTVGAIARRVYAWHRRRLEVNAFYDALQRMDDYTLRDLGFHRSEIRAARREVNRVDEYARTFWTQP